MLSVEDFCAPSQLRLFQRVRQLNFPNLPQDLNSVSNYWFPDFQCSVNRQWHTTNIELFWVQLFVNSVICKSFSIHTYVKEVLKLILYLEIAKEHKQFVKSLQRYLVIQY